MDIEITWGGQTYPFTLDDGEHTVGRASENAVQIPSPRVSKNHARLRIDGERMFVSDLRSSNGTDVNGKPIGGEEVEVAKGMLVSFAGAMMRRAGQMSGTAHTLVSDQTISAQMRYNTSQGYSSAARDRIVEHSAELFELLSSSKDAKEVQGAACQFVAKCVTADRVVMLEDEGEATTIDERARWTRTGESGDSPLQLSTTIINEVMSQRETVLVSNPMDDPKYGGQQSIMALNLRSAMAAPLFDNERVRGILYVDTVDPTVSYGQEDLEVLAATANALGVKLRNISFEREMDTAAQIQRAMLPTELEAPDGYEFEAYQLMCRAVGGDLYHCARRLDGKTLFALGDVSGKGIPAALAMTAATVLIGMLAEIEGSVEALAGHLHRQLFRSLAPEQFITAFLGELDGETGNIRYVNAGHEPTLVLRRDGTLDELEATGLPIAMIEDVMLQEAETTLNPGETLLVFSDGIPEATTDGESFLGLETVKEQFTAKPDDALASIRTRIVNEVEKFLDSRPASDDVTLLLLRRL